MHLDKPTMQHLSHINIVYNNINKVSSMQTQTTKSLIVCHFDITGVTIVCHYCLSLLFDTTNIILCVTLL